jgi:hypothetical protein
MSRTERPDQSTTGTFPAEALLRPAAATDSVTDIAASQNNRCGNNHQVDRDQLSASDLAILLKGILGARDES